MAAKEKRIVHYVEQLKKLVPFDTSECPFGQDVGELGSGANIFDLDLWIKIEPVEQPIICNSVGPRIVSRRWTTAFDDHLCHCFVVLKNVHQSALAGEFCVRSDVIKSFPPPFGMCLTPYSHCSRFTRLGSVGGGECNTLTDL